MPESTIDFMPNPPLTLWIGFLHVIACATSATYQTILNTENNFENVADVYVV